MLAVVSVGPKFIPTLLTGWKEDQKVNAASVAHQTVGSLNRNSGKAKGEDIPHTGIKNQQTLASL